MDDESVRNLFEIDSNTGEISVVNETGVWRINDSDTVTFTILVSSYHQIRVINESCM